jgi:hypothetical protein
MRDYDRAGKPYSPDEMSQLLKGVSTGVKMY